ncbi:vacuolar protein sorting-associated protein 45 [Linnemannia elongata]|uniref:Vacuolar protein sorting-associated protein 45 n=1 Tax=Linnemannia elongata AG-77 TaxID=1314771 RepID=A0A197KB65_9FUNG|nr:vacuolar protein sorting-associated protein 45 [Linnemannia elongata]KAG0079191.1 vacuolar protein sorting-associated protein 45 [Linnemannia elongata]KAK5827578.1 Sec1-like protein [Linnemannia elongata]OAQ34952.1 vacuolar protein sorting 45 [Linnemannia elongata AG-77]
MNAITALQFYIDKMLTDTTGMKVLLLDAETTPIISMVATQSHLLQKETYLVDRIENNSRDKMRHLKCVCFLRPTADSLEKLIQELRDPCYGDYYLYFSNRIKKTAIERLAEMDEHEVVREVQEFYADYYAINPDCFSINMDPETTPLYGDSFASWDTTSFIRTVDGLMGLLLSLKKKPLIRYQKQSAMAKRLATEVQFQIQQEGQLFDFRKSDTPPILLVLDRRNDPVTPLLSQWTYQAMVHELIGIRNGRVDLSGVPDIKPELKEIVLSCDQDSYFQKNMFLNLGDLGANIKSYVDEYQTKTKSNMNIESIADMKRFVEDYPEFRKLSGNVSKHVTLVGELSRLVDQGNVLEVSELEQSLACSDSHNNDLKNLQRLISSPKVSDASKIRLVQLYALRYEKFQGNAVASLIDLLYKNGLSEREISTLDTLMQYGGSSQRQDDLFSNESILSRGRSALKGLKGVENVYTQHQPQLGQILELLLKMRLKEASYPFVEGTTSRDRPQDIIVFMVGGATFEEARYISMLNSTTPGARIILGGTTVHNSRSFMQELVRAQRSTISGQSSDAVRGRRIQGGIQL